MSFRHPGSESRWAWPQADGNATPHAASVNHNQALPLGVAENHELKRHQERAIIKSCTCLQGHERLNEVARIGQLLALLVSCRQDAANERFQKDQVAKGVVGMAVGRTKDASFTVQIGLELRLYVPCCFLQKGREGVRMEFMVLEGGRNVENRERECGGCSIAADVGVSYTRDPVFAFVATGREASDVAAHSRYEAAAKHVTMSQSPHCTLS